MFAYNIQYLREIYNEQDDMDVEYIPEALRKHLEGWGEDELEDQLEMVENLRKCGLTSLREMLVDVVKEWLEDYTDDKTRVKLYNMMCNEKFYDDAFIYTREEFWQAVEDQGYTLEEVAEQVYDSDFNPHYHLFMFNGDGDFRSSDVAAYLIGDFTDVAEFMVEEDLLDEVK